MQARTRHKRGQVLGIIQRRHYNMGGLRIADHYLAKQPRFVTDEPRLL